MDSTQISPLVFSISILLLNTPAYANPMGLNQSDMAFCSSVRDERVREAISSKQSNSGGTVNTNFDLGYAKILGVHGDSKGSGWSNSSSSNSREMAMSQYQSKNCDQLIKTAGEVTIAEINANSAQAIARMQADSAKYSADIQKDIANINAGATVQVTDINAQAQVRITELQQAGRVDEARIISETLRRKVEAEQNGQTERAKIETQALLEMTRAKTAAEVAKAELASQTALGVAGIQANASVAQAQLASKTTLGVASIQTNGSVNQTLIQAGAGLLSTIIAPPSRPAQINADVEKAKIAADLEKAKIAADLEKAKIAAANADPSLALIQNWGLTASACNNSGLVSIAIDNKQYCAFPTDWLSAGQYVYNRSTNNLDPLTSINVSNPSPIPTNNPPQQTEPSVSSGGGFQ